MSAANDQGSQQELENEVAALESRLAEAKRRLKKSKATANPGGRIGGGGGGGGDDDDDDDDDDDRAPPPHIPVPVPTDSAHHYLLLLSDSALPLGSFAFSSGLESYLSHGRLQRLQQQHYEPTTPPPPPPSFSAFLPLSLSSYASTTLPFVLAAHRAPTARALAALDDALDATIVCTVGRRASVAQGRALLSIWEKSLAPGLPGAPGGGARDALAPFAALLRSSSSSTPHSRKANSTNTNEDDTALPPPASAHLPPLFGAVAALLGLSARQAAYVFVLSHAKALVSAAVRAGCFGPYQAQRMLAGPGLRDLIGEVVARGWETPVEEAGQNVPVMDLWVGRHELLYSRIFNS